MVVVSAFSLPAPAAVSDFIRGEPRLTVSRSGNEARITSHYDGEWVKMYVQRGNDIYVVTHSTRQQQWRSRKLGPDSAAYVRRHLGKYLFPSDTEFTVRAGGRTLHFNWEEGEWVDQPSTSGSSGGSSSGADIEDQDNTPVDRGGNQHAGSDPLCRLTGSCGGSTSSGAGSSGSSSSGANVGSSSSTSSSSSSSSSSGASSSSTSSSSGGGIVLHLRPRTVHMKPDITGGGNQERIQIPPADSYYMDLTVRYDSKYDWDSRSQSGKFPGLAGGSKDGGGNCTDERPDSWSARNGFQTHGRMTTYLYFQNRTNGCGVKYPWKNPNGSDFYFQKERNYRVTQFVQVNTPGQANGIDRIWVDGVMVLNRTDIVWRGNVSSSVARVDQLMYHAFFGGDGFDKTPSYDSYVHFGDLYVMSCTPDFTKAAGTCK